MTIPPLLHRLAAWWRRPKPSLAEPAVDTAPTAPVDPTPAYPPLRDPAPYGRIADADDKVPAREWGGPGDRRNPSRGDLLFYTPPGAWKHTPTRARKRKGAKR